MEFQSALTNFEAQHMLAPNTILQGRYQIIRQLGQGGMGTVYEAIDQRLHNTVALKETLFNELHLRKQFEREAELLARLHHPALPNVIDHFIEGDRQCLVMQFIPGEDLAGLFQRRGGAFPVSEVVGWGDQLLDALDYLHTQEPPVIHRDIKPQNLKLTKRGQIILLDFGLAKGFAGQISRMTASGSIFGYTPNYAPLEQIQGTGTEPRSDLYSLAATLYHLMTGVVPPDVLTRIADVANERPEPLRSAHEINPDVSPEVAAVLNKAMAIGSNQRPASAAAMRAMLREALLPRPPASSSSPEITALPPTVLSPMAKTRPQETNPTILSPAPPSPARSPEPFGVSPRASALPARSAREPSRQRWILGGFVALLFVGIIVVALIRFNSETDTNSKTGNLNMNAGNMSSSNTTPTTNINSGNVRGGANTNMSGLRNSNVSRNYNTGSMSK